MKTKSYNLISMINPEIKIGDKVRLWDGSSLTCDKLEKQHFIPYAYPELTGSDKRLKEITATVIETGCNKLCKAVLDNFYLQDILIKVGDAEFRTSSGMVAKQ